MIIGCLLVTGIYMLVNWVFVTNLSQGDMAAWIKGDTDRITLAHLVVQNLIGANAAKAVSVVVIIALLSALSAMTLIGPRVYAAMARDRFLPSFLADREGRPPVGSVVLQCLLAASLVFLSGFREMLNNVGSILAVVSAATVLSLFRRRRWRKGEHPPVSALVGAVVYASMSAWMVVFAVSASRTLRVAGMELPTVILWMLGIVVVAMIAFALTRRVRPEAGAHKRRRETDRSTDDWVPRRRGGSTIPPAAAST
jgi:APA family basic amino acid/polyamine antiporter